MGQMNTVRLLLLVSAYCALAFAQDPDPEVKQACTQYKRDFFEERVAVSFFFANAPVLWKTIDKCRTSKPLIVGGTPAEPKEFPHIARLGNRNDKNKTHWFCGGTLINNRLVLTAAHCLYSPRGEVNVVRLGELDFADDKEDAQPEDFGVDNAMEYPGYNNSLLYDDIAILRLDRPVTFNAYKHPACLPFTDGQRSDYFIAIGWGHQKFAANESTKLLKVQLDNFNDKCLQTSDFDELPSGYNSRTMLCIGSTEHKDTCNGDSGGPVLNYHEEYPCMYHVMGVTSLGNSCDTPNVPSIYTRVHAYLGWIKAEMAKSN